MGQFQTTSMRCLSLPVRLRARALYQRQFSPLYLANIKLMSSMSSNYMFRQLFDRESCTYTYLLADTLTKEAVLIDPVIELSERDASLVKQLDLKLKFVMNTHVHADHITGSGRMKSVWSRILTMPDNTVLYPAHDYKGQTAPTVGEEKQFNPHLTKTEEEFVTLMGNLNLAYPKKIDESLPANMVCGLHQLPESMVGWV